MPLPIIGVICEFFNGMRESRGLTGFIELQRHTYVISFSAVGMKVRYHNRTAVQFDQPDLPRDTFSEIDIRCYPNCCAGNENATIGSVFHGQIDRQTMRAGVVSGIAEPAAFAAALQRETAFRGGTGMQLCGPTPVGVGKCLLPAPPQGIFTTGRF
jgi:hypothetical protein